MNIVKLFWQSIVVAIITMSGLHIWGMKISNDFVQMLTAVFTLGCAWAAAYAAQEAKLGVTAQLMTRLIETYHTDEFTQKLKRLREWKNENNFADEFAKQKADSIGKKNDFPPIYYDWRHVKDYYVTCWRYIGIKFFADDHIKIMMTKEQAAFYLQIIEPMGIAADKDFLREPGKMLRNIFPNADQVKLL